MKNLLIGLPCYNEAENIHNVIEDIEFHKDAIEKLIDGKLSILAVDDGSRDTTVPILKGENVILVQHEVNKGLGEAVNTIFTEFLNRCEEGDGLIILDADFTHKAEFMIGLLNKQKENHSDVVICSRYQEGSEVTGLSKSRELISLFAGLYDRIFLGFKGVKDYTCGYRLYKYEIIDKMRKRATSKGKDKIIDETKFTCMVEVLYKANLEKAKFSEVPFTLYYGDKLGTSKMKVLKTSVDSLLLPFKLRLNK